jgi:hypothetical protein
MNEVALTREIGRVCDKQSRDDVLWACVNIIMNCVRQNYGRRPEAIDKMNELFALGMNELMKHYDPTTGRRRSVIPFDQTISPSLVVSEASFPGLRQGAKANGGT